MSLKLSQKLFYRKAPHLLIEEASQGEHRLKKHLGALDLVTFGVGATIGSGIFALTGTAAAGQVPCKFDFWSTPLLNFVLAEGLGREGAGPAIVISFLLASLACGFAALCYAELAAMIPVSGSAYTFAYACLGELVAWIIGWDLILEYAVGNIAVAVSWSDHFGHFLHALFGLKLPLWLSCDLNTALSRRALLDSPLRELYSSFDLPVLMGQPIALNLPAFAIVAFVSWILVLGIKESALANTVFVTIKIAVVLFFIIYGFGLVKPGNWVPFAPSGWLGIMGGAAIVFFSFIGFDAVSSCAEETKNPQKDMPLGMIGALLICTLLYVLVALVLTGILPYKNYANDAAPVATAMAVGGAPWAHVLVSFGALAGMTSVLLVFQLGQPRIFMAMARDGLLPKFFGRLHPRFHTPYVPTILTGLFVGLSSLMVDIGQAAELTNIGTLAAFIIVCAGVIFLRRQSPELERPFACPFVPLVPILGILSCFLLMLSLPVVTWVRFFVWMALGLLVYLLWGMRGVFQSKSAFEKEKE
jgi:APA family basic amino acid/polyamine antiporter